MSAFMSNPPGSEGPQVLEGVPVLPEPPMFPGLAADVAVQVCYLLSCDPSTTHLIPLQPPTTEANAFERLDAVGNVFDPVPGLFTLPPEGVDILAAKWSVPLVWSVQRHARVLLSPRAQHCDISSVDLGHSRRTAWPAGGRTGGGMLFYCTDCSEWVVGKTWQHHRGAAHDDAVRKRGQEKQLNNMNKGDAKNERRLQNPPGPGYKPRRTKDYRCVQHDATDTELSAAEPIDRGEVGAGEGGTGPPRQKRPLRVAAREFKADAKRARGEAAAAYARLGEEQRLREEEEKDAYWATYNMRASWASDNILCGDEGPG